MTDEMELDRAWQRVAATARRAVADGLVVGAAGNVSERVGDLVVVTPSGVRYGDLGPEERVVVDLDGRQVAGRLRPTSELALHLGVYRTIGARAVVHTHAVHATAVSALVDEVPPVHYITAELGGVVRVAPYATYGTQELADHVLHALRDRAGCLMRNHGTVTHGPDLETAYERTAHLEWICRVWLLARGAGNPSLLSHEEMDRVVEKFRGYGQPGRGEGRTG
ncbi:class II aldolase/adducin family protein [Streptomyces sp. NPDC059506]|uniref:class II aldolase/adducin family protein n=1 Tax=Streptomyces TaxID=1883 RepID=UPI000CB9B09C|nr:MULTISPECIES: class II aldolase/adducin family protein [unclassified Streptomyces]MCZ2526085.1 class II aldolase/adducin family protein [Streptomyces sp. HB2AG]PLW65624.1 fuculose phosphate aldolase [Streptomyces sp. DJ]QMV23979.1 class II aldolase/adducin family protein [Streptomyces sp. SCUT-3]